MHIARIHLTVVALAAVLIDEPARAQTPVDLELVLAVDVSRSMDYAELELQRSGYAAALQHPEVMNAIRSGFHGRVAITYFEWAGAMTQRLVAPWMVIEDERSAAAMAHRLSAAPMQRPFGTSISGALAFAASLFDGNGFDAFRRVIDISGDGPNNIGMPVAATRDAVLAQDMIINGLPIMVQDSPGPWSIADLDVYYADCVIGGPGSFVLPVKDPSQLTQAIRQKLVLEIAGPPPSLLPAAEPASAPRIDCMIGERLRRQWSDP